MALPPMNAATEDEPQPNPGTEEGDMPMEEAAGPVVYATILKMPDGSFALVDGDEPEPMEGEEMAMPEDAQTFPDGPALLKALMDKIEGRDDEEAAFAEGYEGGSAANGKRPMAA